MHLNTRIAFDLMEGRLEQAAEREWTDHLSTCTYCASEMDMWAVLRSSLKRAHLLNAPQPLLASAYALFQPEEEGARRSGIPKAIAIVLFDSFLQPAFEGARGGSATRQVVLRAQELDIHVRISGTDETCEILGQIEPRGSAGFISSARLHLLQNGERISSSEVNGLGEFRFSFVPEGYLSLQIDLPHLTVIGALDVTQKI